MANTKQEPQQGEFPFCYGYSDDHTDTEFVRWWRDRANYLTYGGVAQWLSALYRYSRGVFGNFILLAIPLALLALVGSLFYTFVRNHLFVLTIVIMLCAVAFHVADFVWRQVTSTDMSQSASWEWSRWLLVALGCALVVDAMPFCVEGVRSLRPKGTMAFDQFLAYGALVSAASGTLLRFLGGRAGLQRAVLHVVLCVLSWGSLAAILIALVEYLYFGIPPYGWFLFVPFVAVGIAVGVAVVVGGRWLWRIANDARDRRDDSYVLHRGLCLCAVLVVAGGASMSYLVRVCLEPYSRDCRDAAQAVAEITRPLARLTKALRWDTVKPGDQRNPDTVKLLAELKARKENLDAEQHVTWEDDYFDTPLVTFIAPVQYALVRNWLLPSVNSDLFGAKSSDLIGEWGVLTPIRPNYHQHAVSYLESCARIDKLDSLEKQRLRDTVTFGAADLLFEVLTGAYEDVRDARELRVGHSLAKAFYVQMLLDRLFPGGPTGADRIDVDALAALEQHADSLSAKVRSDGVGDSDAFVSAVFHDAKITVTTLSEMTVANRQGPLYERWRDGTKPTAKDAGADGAGPDNKSVQPFGKSNCDAFWTASLRNQAFAQALLASLVKLHDTRQDAEFHRLAKVIASLPYLDGVDDALRGDEQGISRWKDVLELPIEQLAMKAAGLPPLWMSDDQSPPGAVGTGTIEQPFDLHRHALAVIRFNLAEAAGVNILPGRALLGVPPGEGGDGCADDQNVRKRAQFVLLERAMRPAQSRADLSEKAKAILSELTKPSTPTAKRFRPNLYENERLLYEIATLKPASAVMKDHGVLPETVERLIASRFPCGDDARRECDRTIRRMGVGRFGDLENLSSMVEEVAAKGWWVKATLVGAVLLGLLFFGGAFVEPNFTSIHEFYRDSLSSAFFIAPTARASRRPDRNVKLSELADYDNGSTAPYPLINAACNVPAVGEESERDRKARPFLFSPRWIGGVQKASSCGTGKAPAYRRTPWLEAQDRRFTAASAMTISGAAASPLMGRYTNWAIRLAMVLANVRLGYWIRFPYQGGAGDDVEGLEVVRMCEWQAIRGRRKCAKTSQGDGDPPVGIAFSGGGIRSAAFNFGIAQGLFRSGVWPLADYLSTVSGGGYVGTAISVFMRSKSAGSTTIGDRPTCTASNVTQTKCAATMANPSDASHSGPWIHKSLVRVYREAIDFAPLKRLSDDWLNISDGGHFENLGVYSLLERRCEVMIVGDGEADPSGKLDGLSRLLLLAEVDLGVRIVFRDGDIDAIVKGDPVSVRHFAIAKIEYTGAPADGNLAQPDEGWLIYLRSSLTGDEDQVIAGYKAKSSAFPHESTADQFFNEEKFEAYRRLGEHVINDALSTILGCRPGTPSSPVAYNQFLNAIHECYRRPLVAPGRS